MKQFAISLMILSLLACAQVSNDLTANSTDAQLLQIIAEEQSYQDSLNPFNKENNILYYDASPQALAKHNDKVSDIYHRLKLIDPNGLTKANQINQTILAYKLKNDIDSYRNLDHYMPLTAEAGFHAYMTFMVSRSSFKNADDYETYLNRLVALDRYFEQQTYWLKQGLASGISQPKVVLAGFEESISAFIVDDATKSDFYRPFNNMAKHISAEQQAQLKAKAELIILENINPMYQRFYDFMVDTYIPNAKQTIAAKDYPNGAAFYQNRIEHYTTLTLTADEIHDIGLQEVARIRGEMEEVIKDVEFEGTFAEFVQFLRTDRQFYATTPEQLLKEASFIAKKMDAKLPSLFKTLPRTPYGVVEVPASIAPKYTTGRYSGPSRDDQAGNYWVNTYALDRRPLYVLEALTLHEAVPGHHLQGSIAREMENVPEFRNQTYISAFGEGWGLYSEFLGVEAGFYQDPYSRFGRLTYEMWRAVRLVVDTGMHMKGWSRQQAMDYLARNSALSLHNVKTEIDRYISWPAQALSYKLGEITIKSLRVEAEKALAEDFDLREFHDQILKNGSIPLSLLETLIRDYIEQKAAAITGN
ncbi:DUF885 domain-containing protein [Thalassotalea sp. ND16A]|uniref:DUF885 domain-containing protein n=1 Tax=Thalassotalea sp. ND16A TaxID=1535422 RepID=UPI00051A5746|nr:DUF885 domain-containing protein [Thalassotalea sp. ND16A]KGJ88094.1 hypothetical protein ND16A_2647 [Thalassotalea sp. ND16A]